MRQLSNDTHQVYAPKSEEQRQRPAIETERRSGSLKPPPIVLNDSTPASQKSTKKIRRRRRRRRFRRRKTRSGFRRKSRSSSKSSTDTTDASKSYETEITYVENPRIDPLKDLFNSLILMYSVGITVGTSVQFFFNNCSAEDASLTTFDNMVAYVVTIVSFGCIVFSKEVQMTKSYSIIYRIIFTCAINYMSGKIVCARNFRLALITLVIASIQLLEIYVILVQTKTDFTPLIPSLTVAYAFTTLMNILIIYSVNDNVPIAMVNVINIFLTFGLTLCVAQISITSNPEYLLPSEKRMFLYFLFYITSCCLIYHIYFFIVPLFNE